MKIPLLFLVLFCSLRGNAQSLSISGKILNMDKSPLAGASVTMVKEEGKDSVTLISGPAGDFRFGDVLPGTVEISVSYVGYKKFTRRYDFHSVTGNHDIPSIILIADVNELDNITLEATKVQIKEDTVSYLIDSSMYRRNDNVEEVLKKLPGIQVDKNGTVTAQGKEVTKVKVNGKEFFGGDVKTATRELNADMVEKIQVIDDYGDQSAFTGIRDGDPSKTLNIQLKKDKNKGYFGNVTAGAGTHNRYIGSLSLNQFNNNRQLSLIGNINNTNSSPFNFGAIGGSMGSVISSMARGMGIGQGGGGVAATLGNFSINDGVGVTKSIGVNYRDEWSQGTSAYGSYSFSQKDINTIKSLTQETTDKIFPSSSVQNSNDVTTTINHRFSFNVEHKADSFNYIKFSPTITYRRTRSHYSNDYTYYGADSSRVNEGSIAEFATSASPAMAGNILFNHRFRKKGRTVSFNLNATNATTDGTDDLLNPNMYYLLNTIFDTTSHQYIPQNNRNTSYGVKVSYVEPLNKKQSLEFNYSFNNQYTDNEREVYVIDAAESKTLSDSLSSIYSNVYNTHRLGINFRTNQKRYNYTIGFAAQPGTIQSNSTKQGGRYKQNLVNYFPVLRFAYNFSRSRAFNINYNGYSNQPSYTQLNPARDVSNAQNIVIGNPDLRPEFTNTLSTRYNNFDFISGNVFFGNILASFTTDKIVNDVTLLGPTGKQETRYRNANGYYTVTAFYNISRPKNNRKFVFNWGGNLIYNNNVSYIRGSRNTGRNWIFGQRLAEDIKIKKWLETSFAVNYSLNKTSYTASNPTLQNLNLSTWTLSHSARIFFTEDFIFSYDLDKTFNSGYASNVNSNPLIINATLEKQFLKKRNLSLKLQSFDLLNENRGVSRTVTGASITDTKVNRLARYFLFTAIYRLNKFKSDQQGPANFMSPGPAGGMRPF